MAEAPGDWKVMITLDRKLLVRDIDAMVHILARQRMSVIVSASSGEEAEEKAGAVLQRGWRTRSCYVKALTPRRLPT